MIILGIETSCDETALALIETRPSARASTAAPAHIQSGAAVSALDCRVIASLVHSQAALHSAYGGVYPSLAKREHGKNLVPLLHKLLIQADGALASSGTINDTGAAAHLERFKDEVVPQNPELYESFAAALSGPRSLSFLRSIPKIDRIAVTEGPGLEPALWVGLTFARMLGEIWDIPIVPVNHMEGHVVGSMIPSDAPNGEWQTLFDVPMPAVAFLISGGHTELIEVARIGSYKLLGETQDDAVGEAFDKTARLLGFPYPGGPHISMAAAAAREAGIEAPVELPRPMIHSGDLNFSFSGLKTAVLYATRKAATDETGALPDAWKKGLAREFEDAITETLVRKLRGALDRVADTNGMPAGAIIMGGGVVANHVLREAFKKVAAEYAVPIFLPTGYISGDNALMIAVAGAMKDGGPTAANSKNGGSPAKAPLKAHGTKRLSE
jgi:N6-L-threonylcarbamoyladenine synthase